MIQNELDRPARAARQRGGRMKYVAGALILSLAQNLLISVDFGGLFSDISWYVPTQFRDYIAVGALVVILLLRPRRVAGRAPR